MWQKGQSGNPNGRPRRGRSITKILDQISQEQREPSGPTRLRELVETAWALAESGDVPALKLIFSYIQPEPKDQESAPPAQPFIVQGVRFVEAERPTE